VRWSTTSGLSFGWDSFETASVVDSLLGGVGGAEVVACGRNALLRLLVTKVRREGDAEIRLEVNCLWLAHRMLLEGASRVEKGDALERMRASATLRSSIDFCFV
jgi:hypothetical protein